MNSIYDFDRELLKDYPLLCGVDEAGRGPLAGPVYAAAVILRQDFIIEGINDSKKLTEKKREELFFAITENALDYGIAYATVEEIDEINILNAAMLAMKRAVDKLKTTADMIIVDGNKSPQFKAPSATVVKGDLKSACIAAASILAKVSRDNYMTELDRAYPVYMFAQHKGYPTRLHYEMLDKYGASEVHRKSFLRKWENREEELAKI